MMTGESGVLVTSRSGVESEEVTKEAVESVAVSVRVTEEGIKEVMQTGEVESESTGVSEV